MGKRLLRPPIASLAGLAVLALAVLALWFGGAFKSGERSGPAVDTFYNPIMVNGADPWVVQKDGCYYYTHTVGDAIQIWKSRSLPGIAAGETAIVWTPPSEGPNTSEIWAPEIHWINGKWYIYYAADDGLNEHHRMFVLESETEDALGAYKDRGKIADPSDKWAIDGTVLQKEDGSLYFIWSGWEGDENVSQRLYIAPMSNPYTISGERVEISRPELDWELIGQPTINEGPEVLISDKKISVVYSASGSWTDDYTLGLLSADLGADLLNPASWKKHPAAVFAKTDDVFGPGHSSFVKSPDGKEDWIVYHAAKGSGSGWDRNVRIQPFEWNDDGTPNFGRPLSTRTAVRLPSGEEGRVRLEAENAALGGGMKIADRNDASSGKTVGGWGEDGSYAEFGIDAAEQGMHMLALRYFNEGAVEQNLTVTINGKTKIGVKLDNAYNGAWANAFIPVPLQEGSNTVKLSGGDEWLSLDAVDVLPPEQPK